MAQISVLSKTLIDCPEGATPYSFKRAWKDGTYAVVFDPLDFVARLAALIPPPNFHMLRYHGVLAAHANARGEVVPGPAPESVEPTQLRLVFEGEATELEPSTKPASRQPWAWRLQRVFAVDVMTCPKCEGRLALKTSPGCSPCSAWARGLRPDHGHRRPDNSSSTSPPEHATCPDPDGRAVPSNPGSWASWA